MKEIYAIIQMNKLQATKKALANIEYYPMCAFPALGHGSGAVEPTVLEAAARGCEEAIALLGKGPTMIPKRSISIMAPDDKVEEIVNAIISVNKTGHPDDGKIFVCPLDEAVRIRTGESGDEALN